MKRRFFLITVILVSMVFFFIDMKHEPGSAVYQLYGFAHLAFFMLKVLGFSWLHNLARRPFLFQFMVVYNGVRF